jgi:pSer/pThr/pTyr-binding forkhead associated (FHA) protein
VVRSAEARLAGPRLALLDDGGQPYRTVVLDRSDTVVGRAEADLVFADDVFLSPVHAQFAWRDGRLYVRDLGSRNGTWVFLEQPHRLADGDVVLIGSQLVRFRRLGYPGPHPPEADATRRLGSLVPGADVAVLAQLRGDGSTRDTLHLSPGRSVRLGRIEGDWVFPYDQTMSSRHAEIISVDGDFYLQDSGSRNGVAVAVRGEVGLARGQRVLMGDQMFRVESL